MLIMKIKQIALALLCVLASAAHAQSTTSTKSQKGAQSALVFDGFAVVSVVADSAKDSTYKTCPVSKELIVIQAGPFDASDFFRCEKSDGDKNKPVLVVKTVDQLLEEEMGPDVHAIGVLPIRDIAKTSPRQWKSGQIMILYKKN
jgi:hypothetical protein